MRAPGASALRGLLAPAALALVCFSPFVRGSAAGATLYFRDLSLQFFPLRRFVSEGLRSGQLRYWNPYAFEGVPTSVLPLGYPLDLLHVLRPDDVFFSLLLAAHIPLAALGLYALARQLGVGWLGAAAGGCLFALGGFALSTVNLYVYAQALAWVPIAVVTLVRAANGGRREVAWAAAASAMLLSTTAVEFFLQAIVVGALLALPSASRRGTARVAAALGLSLGLAAVVVAPLSALVGGSARAAGFPSNVVLAHSVHPIALLQVVIAGLFGDPTRMAERFWGTNFFPRGFPYMLSLYCGASGLALAAVGALEGRPPARRLVLLGALGLVACVGQWAGLAPVVDALSPLRKLRFPVKAFLTVQLVAALLAALAVDACARGQRRALVRLAWLAGLAGLAVAAVPLVALHVPALALFVQRGFFPPEMPWALRTAHVREIADDACRGGALALLCAMLALVARTGRARAPVSAAAITLVLAADLLRAGAGLNPMARPEEISPSPEAAALAARLRADGGRLYPLDPSYSPAYFAARALRAERHELWSFAVLQDSFAPDTNLRSGVPTALTPDRTMLVPADRVTVPELADPQSVPALVPRLQAGGVSHVLSVDTLQDPSLVSEETVAPPRLAPLALHVYRVADAKPLAEVLPDPGASGRLLSYARRGDHVEVEVELRGDGRLVLREALGRGWVARVDGRDAGLEPVESHYVSLRMTEGRHGAQLDYEPPLLGLGAAVSGLSLLLTLWLARARGAVVRHAGAAR